jgi:hypothetical protein
MRPCIALLIFLAAASCANDPQPLDPDTLPLPRPAPKQTSTPTRSISGAVTWESVSEPITAEQLNLDQAKCALSADLSLRTTPELKYSATFDQCMRAKGYRVRIKS